MGGRGVSENTNSVERAISNIEKNPLDVSREEIQDIYNASYGLNVNKLSAQDRQKLANILGDDAVNKGGIVQTNIKNLDEEGLKDYIRITSKVQTTASTFAMEDAFKVLSYYKNGKSSRTSMVDNERGWKYPEVTQNVTKLEKSLNSARSANKIQSISQALRKQDARITAEIERLHNGTADVKGSEKALLTERRRVRQLIKRAKI